MIDNPLGIDVLNAQQVAYDFQKRAQFRSPDYISRGFQSRFENDIASLPRPVQGYNELLPTYQGRIAEDVIGSLVQTNTGVKRIGDIGCGIGQVLYECSQKWGANARYYGLTSYPYKGLSNDRLKLGHEEICEYSGLDIRVGDAQHMEDRFPPNFLDVAMSVYMMNYLADPWLAVIGMYQTLKVNGVGLIHNLPPALKDEADAEKLRNFLIRSGVEVTGDNRWNLSFRKSSTDLHLPITYNDIWEGDYDPTKRLTYAYNCRD